MQYFFGAREISPFKTEAENLDEAIENFCLSIVDFAFYAYTREPDNLLRENNLKVPFGYNEDGTKNSDFHTHRYYHRVPIFVKKTDSYGRAEFERDLTFTEFKNFHLNSKNLLAAPEIKSSDNSLPTVTGSMMQIKKMIHKQAFMIRDQKLKMALTTGVSAKENIQNKVAAMKKELKK